MMKTSSFHGPTTTDSEEEAAAEHLADILRENRMHIDGSSWNRGAHYFCTKQSQDGGGSLQFCDLGDVAAQLHEWRRQFKHRVQPYYFINKYNSDPFLIDTMAAFGAGFNCASINEVRAVRQALACSTATSGVPDVILATPRKTRSHIIECVGLGVRKMHFDSAAELAKCAAVSKDIELILRVKTEKEASGAPRAKWRELLTGASRRGLRVVGVSLNLQHGTSILGDLAKWDAALKDAHDIFLMAEELGIGMTVLDIQGHFPLVENCRLTDVACFGPVTIAEEENEDDDLDIETGMRNNSMDELQAHHHASESPGSMQHVVLQDFCLFL